MAGHGTARRLNLTGFEGGNLAETSTVSGSVNTTVQNSVVRSGSWALRCNPGNAQRSAISFGVLTGGPSTNINRLFFRGYFRFASLPSSDRILVGFNSTTVSTTAPAIRFNAASGTLSVVSALSGGTVYGTGSTALTTDTWYRVEFGLDNVNNKVSLRVDGNSEIDYVAVGDLPTTSGLFYVGVVDQTGGACDLYVDDLATDDQNWCGAGSVTRLNLSTLDANSGWTVSSGTAVSVLNKSAVDDTTWVDSTTTNSTAISLAPSGVPSGTVRGVVWRARVRASNGANTGNVQWLTKLGAISRSTTVSGIPTAAYGWIHSSFYDANYDLGPTGGVWSRDRVLNGKFGLQNASATYGTRCSMLVVEVEVDSEGAPNANRVWVDNLNAGTTTLYSTTGTVSASTAQQKSGTHSLLVTPGTSAARASASSVMASTTKEFFLRAWVYLAGVPGSTANTDLLGTGTATGAGLWLALHQDGSLQIRDVDGLLGSATAANTLPLATWTRVELQVRTASGAATTDGVAEVRVNGATVLTTSSAKTTALTNPSIVLGTIRAPAVSGFSFHLDDVVADKHDWVGESSIYTLRPTGAGSTTSANFTVSGAASKWQALTSFDDNTSYVSCGNVNPDEESYTIGSVPTSGTVAAVFLTRRRNSSIGSTQTFLRFRSGTTAANSGGSDAAYTTDFYRPTVHEYEGAWSQAMVNSSELVLRNTSTTVSRVSYLDVMVEVINVSSTTTKELAASSVVQQSLVAELTASAFIVRQEDLAADASVVSVNDTNLLATGLVSQEAIVELGSDASLVSVVDLATDASLAFNDSRYANATAIVLAELTLQATASAIVFRSRELDLELGAVVRQEHASSLTTGAYVSAENTVSLTAEAYVSSDLWAALSASAVVGEPGITANLSCDAYIFALELVAGAVVKEANLSAQLIATSFVRLLGAAELTTTSQVVTGTLTSSQLEALGWVAGPGELQADAILTNSLSSARYALLADGVRMTDGERTDGTSFVAPRYSVANSWVAGFACQVVAVALAIDTGRPVDGATLTVTLEAGNQTRTVNLANDDWAVTASPRIGWVALPVAPVTVAPGDECRIAVSGDGPTVLVTQAGTTMGFSGPVLNSFAITDQEGVPDQRPLVALSLHDGNTIPATTLTIGSQRVDALWVGVNTTVVLDPSHDVRLEVDKLAFVAGALRSEPVGVRHEIVFGPEGGLVVDGSLVLAGETKTRWRTTTQNESGTLLHLDQPPVNWQAGDQLWVATEDGSTVGQVVAVTGSLVELGMVLNQTVPAGALVANLSRSCRVRGHATGQAAKLWSRGSLVASHVELQSVGRGTALAENYELDDVVLWETSYEVDSNAPVLIRPGGTANDLTLARSRQGVYCDRDWELGGETLLLGMREQAVRVAGGELAATLRAADVGSAVVTLEGNASFSGRIDADTSGVRAISGSNGRVRLRGGSCAGTLLALDGGMLGELDAEDVVAGGWVAVTSGLLGSGSLRRCQTDGLLISASAPVVCRISDEDGLSTPATGVVLLPGSRVANRTTSWGGDGWHDEDATDAVVSAASLRLTATNGWYETELLRVPLAANETLRLGFWAKGSLTVRIEEDEVSVDSADWAGGTIEHTATTEKVVRVRVATTTTGRLDGLARLA